MANILKIFQRKFKASRYEGKSPHEEPKKVVDESSTSINESLTPVTPTSSNLTLISSSVNPLPKLARSLMDQRFNNNNVLSTEGNDQTTSEVKSNPTHMIDVDEQYLSYCLSGFSKERYTGNTGASSLLYPNEVATFNSNKTNYGNHNVHFGSTQNIKEKLTEDHEKLLQKNRRLRAQFQKTHELNEKLKVQIEELENMNEKLMSDNTEVLQEAIKHRFLKLESEDLSKKASQCKQKLEEKENTIVNFQRQFENLKVKNNIAFKRKEEALLEASHSRGKLKELANDCAQLDIYKCENVERKYYFNELQGVFGNIRVYLKIKPTVGESCVSFVADDKILICVDEKKSKNLICHFTKVFQPHQNNNDIFEEIHPLLTTVVDGYNCSFINYGQRGSGKTITFFGDNKNPGMLSRSLNYLLTSTSEMMNQTCDLYVSAIEVSKDGVVDIFRKRPIQICDDGRNIILKSTEEKLIKSDTQCKELVDLIQDHRKTEKKSRRSVNHLIVITRVNIISTITKEVSCGVAMFCDLAGFESESNLCTTDRSFIKQEKVLHDTLIDLGKTLITLKSKRKKLPRPNTVLTKLLQPCLNSRSKCCLIIHSLSDKDQRPSIVKSIQYGLAVMPKQKEKEAMRKNIIQWQFCDNE